MNERSPLSSAVHRRDVNAIEDAIEITRRDLDETLAALQLRLSPRRRWEEVSSATRERVQRAGRETAGFARRHPQPLITFATCLTAALLARWVLSYRQRRG
jgi:hypothetical protein